MPSEVDVLPLESRREIDLRAYQGLLRSGAAPLVQGRLAEVVGLVLEAVGCKASVGDLFEIRSRAGQTAVQAEVIGLRGNRTLLMPLGSTQGLQIGTPLRRVGNAAMVGVGPALLGRVVDALGRPLDGQSPPLFTEALPLFGVPRNPLRRRAVQEPLRVGVRAIDGPLTLARGQRIGIFAGGGVGKSSLLGMMIRRTEADVAVVALIGERGREVEEFVNRTLGPQGMQRAVVVAATSAEPPLVRARGALYATTIAEYFSAKGLNVLLVMDSATRYAMALREIGLAAGEPATTKGYTPSVFAALPQLLERAGTSAGAGSITGIYTVLVEGDDLSDPIADAARAILDGHIVLSRKLAERGHFPAIDVAQSISRVMSHVVARSHLECAQQIRELLGAYREAEDLLSIGVYKRGALPRLDTALDRMPRLEAFLRQRDEENPPASIEEEMQKIWSASHG